MSAAVLSPAGVAAMRSTDATLLAFDFGTKRIGIAVGNTVVRSARPLTTIESEANATRFAAIASVIDEWQPQALVVGIPVHADGSGARAG